jgi:hypothetical protein
MMGEFALAIWLLLVGYIIWFLGLAKDYVPLTGRETTLLWTMHKRQSNCFSTKFETIRHKNKLVGFRCGCGYKYLSKRLVTQRDMRARILDASRKNEGTFQEDSVYLERYE